MARTVKCSPATRAGRLRKATQFHRAAVAIFDLAEDAADVGDAYVTLLVHAGIAAADVICCARLGEHSTGDNHVQACDLLRRVDAALASDLATLLGMKTIAGYADSPVSEADRRRGARAAERLVQAATLA